MQQSIQHIQQELDGLYSKQEISVLTQLILEEVCGNSYRGITRDKNNHLYGLAICKIEDIVRRLKSGEPVQYILGKAEFYGIPFKVGPDVLIPRPETEELVEWVLSGNLQPGCSVLDIGTGSGCIAVTLAKKLKNAEVHAWDISEGALKVATDNARLNGVKIQFSLRDIFQPVDVDLRFDVIVSNPPYVTESERITMEANVVDYEPHLALFVSDDHALVFYERIADVALQLLNEEGELYFEINRKKGSEVCDMLLNKGFGFLELRRDISGNVRMVRAVKIDGHE